jgi:DNA polymerase-3 subunit delta
MAEAKKQIFLWYGDNDFEIHEKISGWAGAFEKKFGNLNIVNFDVSETKNKDAILRNIKNAFQVNSLFGDNKLVIFRDFLTAKAKLGPDIENLIFEYFDKMPSSFFVIFAQKDAPDKRTKLFKAFQSADKKGTAEVKAFNQPQGADLNKWIIERAKKYGAALDMPAVNQLAFLTQGDLWQADNELHKLCSYKPNSTITTADINLLVKGKYNDDIFALMDAISARDKKRAIKLMRDQLDSGQNEIYLLTMLIRQFRILWQIKEASEAGFNSPDLIAAELGIHPFVVKKTFGSLRAFSREQLRMIYNRLLEFEIKMKTTSADFEVLFDLLLVKI